MGNRNKRKNSRIILHEQPKQALNQDYDLTQSFNRVRPYSKYNRKNTVVEETYSDEEQSAYGYRGYVSSNFSQYEEKTTGTPSWDRYDRLEDKFSSFSDKNEQDHTNLRKELEGKIDRASDSIKDEVEDLWQGLEKKLSKQWYIWTIVGLATIVSIFWMLSYQEVSKAPTEIIKIENRINKLENVLNDTPLQEDTIKTNTTKTDIKKRK